MIILAKRFIIDVWQGLNTSLELQISSVIFISLIPNWKMSIMNVDQENVLGNAPISWNICQLEVKEMPGFETTMRENFS